MSREQERGEGDRNSGPHSWEGLGASHGLVGLRNVPAGGGVHTSLHMLLHARRRVRTSVAQTLHKNR